MKPYVWPSSDEAPPISARRTFPRQFQLNHGTLNLFAPCSADSADLNNNLSATKGPKRCSSSPITGQRTLRYCNHNRESTATREFPVNGLRAVPPPSRSEAPHGIRHFRSAAGAEQHVQVVSITAAYRDPAQMGPLKTGVRCVPQKGKSTEVEAALAYAGTRQQLSARVLHAPVGKAAQPTLFNVDYSLQEKFAQSVRDHAQRRARGVAEFYVQLVRNAVGGMTRSTPKPAIVPWSLEEEPPRPVLTLGRCHDQLVALTTIPISLHSLAMLVWGSVADKENIDVKTGEVVPLEDRVVSFNDFAAAFGQNSSDGRLARMKI